jgi:hypothetical protein
MVATLGACVLVLFARYQYRGDHDTKDGLALKPSATVATTAPPPPPTPSTVEPAPKVVTTTVEPPPAPTPFAPTAVPAATAPTVTATTRVAAATTTQPAATERPTAATEAPAASAPTNTGLSAESITQAAQRALEGKDKDEKQGTRAAQLAFLATQQDPGNADAWLTLGAAYEAMGKKQQAIEQYRNCARRASTHPRVSECKQLAGIKD